MEYSKIIKVTEVDIRDKFIHKEMFTDYYLKYFISLLMDRYEKCSILFIEKELCKIYGNNTIVLKELINFLDENFYESDYEDGVYDLWKEDNDCLNDTKKLKNVLSFLDIYSKEEICNTISILSKEYLKTGERVVVPYVLYLMREYIECSIISNTTGEQKNNFSELENIATNICLANYYNWLIEGFPELFELKKLFKRINNDYSKVGLDLIIDNSYLLSIFYNLGFEKVSDLKYFNSHSQSVLFSILNVDYEMKENIKMLALPFKELLISRINKLFKSFPREYFQLINLKVGIETGKGMSNHEIAFYLKTDIGNIKKIECNVIQYLKEKNLTMEKILLSMLFKKNDLDTKYIVNIDALRNYIDDDKTWRYVVYLYDVLEIKYRFDSKTHSICNIEKIVMDL